MLLDNWRSLKVEPELRQLQNYIVHVRANWKTIGVQLGIKATVLDHIEQRYHDIMQQYTEVLITWQRNMEPPFLWTTFIEVLTAECIAENALAKEICDNVLASQDTYNLNIN